MDGIQKLSVLAGTAGTIVTLALSAFAASFAANMGFADSSLIIGRNFDFYINDAFAEDKIVCFENPDKGYQFAYITWASMIGVVSGMNNQGLTVTINAGKSDIPYKAAGF